MYTITDELFDPKLDLAFKALFGNDKENFANLTNAVLDLHGEKQIQDVTFLNLEFPIEYEGDKEARLDVLAKLKDGSLINIEMQFSHHKSYENRSLYYFS